jgi:hypothetical protein
MTNFQEDLMERKVIISDWGKGSLWLDPGKKEQILEVINKIILVYVWIILKEKCPYVYILYSIILTKIYYTNMVSYLLSLSRLLNNVSTMLSVEHRILWMFLFS